MHNTQSLSFKAEVGWALFLFQANDFQDYNRNEKRTYEALVTGVFCGIFNFSKKRHKKICKLQVVCGAWGAGTKSPWFLNTGKYLIFVRTGLPSVLRTAGQEWWIIPELPWWWQIAAGDWDSWRENFFLSPKRMGVTVIPITAAYCDFLLNSWDILKELFQFLF